MKRTPIFCLFIILLSPGELFASVISNGDFATCDYTNWSKDTDGFGDISVLDDFTMTGSPDCAAVINVDSGTTEAFFGNTLFQNISLQSNMVYELSFDMNIGSELSSLNQNFVADSVIVGFGNGSGSLFDETGQEGFLFETDIDGSSTYSITLVLSDALTLLNPQTLEFQLLIGFDAFGSDSGASFMQLDNISLTGTSTTVDEPLTSALFGVSLACLLFSARTRAQRGVL
ncbi:MAG: hypothetical protein CL587_09425 [Alteromonadaceae bacterium]|nr:hypothetical protein [Alteromonadaceae bacterium]